MSRPSLFDVLAAELEERTPLNRLEARGTLRLALRKGGLEANKLTRAHTAAVVEKILPDELRTRGVPEVEALCDALRARVERAPEGAAEGHRPEALFERLRREAP